MLAPALLLAVAFSFSLTSIGFGQESKVAEKKAAQTEEDKEKEALYTKLSEYLSGTKWTGQFTMADIDNDDLVKEAYYILSATKMDEGDYWKIVTRIKYGKNDTTVSLPMEIKWAGETPVITVDKMLVPGLGTFDARVLIRRGKYSGTWAHNKVGGHLFGEIEKMTDEELAELKEKADK